MNRPRALAPAKLTALSLCALANALARAPRVRSSISTLWYDPRNGDLPKSPPGARSHRTTVFPTNTVLWHFAVPPRSLLSPCG